MKRFVLFLFGIFICIGAIAHTINWHDGNTTTQTTCTAGDNITPPTPVGKYGYHLREWAAYKQIEYIESTGTQWIDTEYILNLSHKINIVTETEITKNAGTRFFLGGSTRVNGSSNDSVFNIEIQNDALRLYYQNSSVSNFFSQKKIQYSSPQKIEFINNNVDFSAKLNNEQVIYSNQVFSYGCTYSMLLFSDGRQNLFGYTKMYYFQIYDNDVLVRDFIPVLDGKGVPCMYDKVEGKFYYNQGTGQFIAGPVLQ